MIKFTKAQQRKIDAQADGRAKQTCIEHFTHIQEMKQMSEVKTFNKQLRSDIKRLQA